MTVPPCPVCRARFRGAATCSRCGADLAPLLALLAAAREARARARAALAAGDLPAARRHARLAQSLCSTPEGRALEAIAAWLALPAGAPGPERTPRGDAGGA